MQPYTKRDVGYQPTAQKHIPLPARIACKKTAPTYDRPGRQARPTIYFLAIPCARALRQVPHKTAKLLKKHKNTACLPTAHPLPRRRGVPNQASVVCSSPEPYPTTLSTALRSDRTQLSYTPGAWPKSLCVFPALGTTSHLNRGRGTKPCDVGEQSAPPPTRVPRPTLQPSQCRVNGQVWRLPETPSSGR